MEIEIEIKFETEDILITRKLTSVEVYTVLKIDEKNYLEKNPTFLDVQMGDEYYE